MSWSGGRRFLAMAGLAVWQGGFAFYGAFVVPVGQRVLGSHVAQGMVTQEVSRSLNLVGVGALGVMLWEALATAERRTGRLVAWGVMAALLGVLFALHPAMDALVAMSPPRVLDGASFARLHRAYLFASTAQWVAAVVYLWLTVGAARRSVV